jgi:hypothetical protein
VISWRPADTFVGDSEKWRAPIRLALGFPGFPKSEIGTPEHVSRDLGRAPDVRGAARQAIFIIQLIPRKGAPWKLARRKSRLRQYMAGSLYT